MVGRVRLARDEQDRPAEPLLTQRRRGGGRGDPAADEQDVDVA
jgi:hypothetical protein